MEGAAWHDASVDDRAVARAVLDGDRDAFQLIVEREASAVYRTCTRILGRPHDAEDVVQEAFLMAYRSIATYRGHGTLGGWLQRIAQRQAFRRLGQRRETEPLELVPEPRARSSASDPALAVLAGERQRLVRASVAALDEPYREVVALRFFAELSLPEIAEATGRPLNTVKTHLRRGMERLRDALGIEVIS